MFQLKFSILIAVALLAIHCAENPPAQQETVSPQPQLSPQEQAMREMEKNWKPSYTIDIDSTVFNHSRIGVYTSDKYDKAAISVAILPMIGSFNELKTKFLSRKPREGEVEKFKGLVKMDGRDVLVSKMLVNQEGLELAMQLYQLAGSDNQVIAVTCASKPADEAGLTPLFEKAVKSVKLK